MASSQIQIASAPYDRVLRDHNRRIRDRERECSSKARFTFQKNIDELVRDHLNNCWGSNEEMNSPTFGMMGTSRSDENGRGENKVESDAMSQTRVIDRWATHQAKEMITTIERQTHQAELLALSSSQTVSERTSTFLRESSPSPLDSFVDVPNLRASSVDVPNLRASSLVQMWKEFEAEAISPRANQSGSLNSNSNVRYSRLNSIVSNNENSSVGESPMSSETDDRFDTHSYTEWESEQTAPSGQRLLSFKRQSSDATERLPSFNRQSSDASEGAKVAAIVKRLTSSNGNEKDQEQTVVCEPSSSVEHSVSDQREQGNLTFNRKRLRVRGRQATKDLLMQMMHERYRELGKLAERHAVSLFPQRGRIQSLLRLKFLQRGVAIQDQRRPASAASELDQLHGRSSIFLLRERFSTRAKQDGNAPFPNEVQNPIQLLNAAQDSGDAPVQKEDNLSTCIQLLDSGNVPDLNEDNLQSHSQLLNATQDLGYSRLSVHLTSQDLHHEDNSQTRSQLLNATQDLGHSGMFDRHNSQDVHHEDATTFEHSAQTETVDHSIPSTSDNNMQTEYHSLPSTSEQRNCWISDVTQQGLCADNLDSEGPRDNERTSNGWQGDIVTEETELNTMYHIGSIDRWEMLTEEPDSNPSWLNGVSCPPRGWECRKQTWYDDGVENNSEEEVRTLLERRTVSNLLASSFRERLDRLILLHLRRHPEIFGSAEQDETIGHLYQEVRDDPDQVDSPSSQLPLPSRLRPWSQYQDQEVSYDSDQVAYTSLQPPQQSSSEYQDSQQCSPFTNRPSLEMELIYGHIERLQYEMSELRESIKTCVAMQVNLQNSIKQEVAAAVCHSMAAIRGKEATEFSHSVSAPKRKGNCCICSMQVDSLLYKCGHMCTCFKCAHELQWSSSRCPICRAPILDVVRAYSDP